MRICFSHNEENETPKLKKNPEKWVAIVFAMSFILSQNAKHAVILGNM